MSKRTNLTRIQSPLDLLRSCFLIVPCVLMATLLVGAAQATTVVRISDIGIIQPGDTIIVPIMLDSVTGGLDIAGFDFLIAWEPTDFRLIEAQPGQLLTDCGWEYFQFSASTMDYWDITPVNIPTVRIASLADMNNGDIHPSCNATSPGELARLVFEVSSHPSNYGSAAPVRFLWQDCGDNGVALTDGSFMLSDQVFESGLDWSEDGSFPTWFGAPNECTEGGAVREINFYNGRSHFAYGSSSTADAALSIAGEQFTWLGAPATAEINIHNLQAPWTAVGFDLQIQYNITELTLVSAQLGHNLAVWNWEYFNYTNDPAQGLIRLVSVADLNNGDIHPSNPLNSDCTVATLQFTVVNNMTNAGRELPLRFLWSDCGDNSFASGPVGDSLYVSNNVYDEYGFLITSDEPFPTNGGAPGECLTAPTIRRSVNFFGSFIKVATEDPWGIFGRGDVNLNGLSYEIADWVLFINYFFYGLSVFNVNIEAQVANTEINNDGLVLTTADLMFLYRVIIGDTEPIWKNGAVASDTAYIIQDTVAHTLSVSYPDSLAMLFLTFSGTFDSVQFESETHDIVGLVDGPASRMMVTPKIGPGEGVAVLPNGFLMNYIGDALLVAVQAEYDGITTIPALVQIGDGSPCCIDRGNINHDPAGALDISDLVYLVDYMFDLGPTPPCPGEANVDGNGVGGIDISDLVYLVDYMFNGGPAPVQCP